MRLFKFESRKVRDLKETIWDMQRTIDDKNDYISHLKAEVDFLRGRNHLLKEKVNRNVVTYKAVKHINEYDSHIGIPDEWIRKELAEILTEAVAKHMKVEKSEQTEWGTMHYATIDIVKGEEE